MRTRTLLALALSAVLLVPLGAGASNGKGGQPTYQVSGGGQILVSTNGNGPGTTIAFVAQGQGETGEDNARGQLQIVERDGPGRPTDKFHGIVDCIVPDFEFDAGDDETVEGARFGGHERGNPERRFIVDVIDNGQPVDGTDLIAYRTDNGEPVGDCDDEEGDDAPEGMLGRGNVKIHDRR